MQGTVFSHEWRRRKYFLRRLLSRYLKTRLPDETVRTFLHVTKQQFKYDTDANVRRRILEYAQTHKVKKQASADYHRQYRKERYHHDVEYRGRLLEHSRKWREKRAVQESEKKCLSA